MDVAALSSVPAQAQLALAAIAQTQAEELAVAETLLGGGASAPPANPNLGNIVDLSV